MKPFRCPNCKSVMHIEKIDIRYKKDTYDRWGCAICPLIVLDWRR